MTTIGHLAEAIHEATGYTGDLLTQATMVAACLYADATGNKPTANYFARRAQDYGKQSPRETPEAEYSQALGNHRPGWNFGNQSLD